MIYLDHAATTPLAPEVLAAMLPWLDASEGYGNPASEHPLGRAARAAVEHARARVATAVGALAEEIIWTSGATEANNLAIKGALEFRGMAGAHIVTSRIEHKSVHDTCRYLETRGVRVTYLQPDRQGRLTVEQIMAALRPETLLVSLMWVNNETGVVNPVEALAPLTRERGILLHVDAVQAVGKLPIDLKNTPIDLLSMSAHKLRGPKGIGALFVRKRPRARLAPQLHGGGHEQGMRSGTLPTHQCVGMGVAVEQAVASIPAQSESWLELRDALAATLCALPGATLNSTPEGAPHLLNLGFAGVDGEALRAALPSIAVSSGSACSSATREPSYVLRALGRDDRLAGASLRFSFGAGTTRTDIAVAQDRVTVAVNWLRALASGEMTGVNPLGLSARDNVYGYPASVWERFIHARYAGRLAEGKNVVSLLAEDAASGAHIEIDLTPDQVRWRALGCPVTIAVADWLADWVLTAGAERPLIAPSVAQLRAALEIPDDKAHCALLGEQLARAVVDQLSKSHEH